MTRALAMAFLSLVAAGPALAASEGGGTAELFWSALNFAMLIAALVYFARKPVAQFFGERRDRIREELRTSASLLSEAEARYSTWQRKLAEVERETREIQDTARRRAEEERDRILAAARDAAQRIRNDARQAVDQELQRAREQLRREALDLAVQLAAEQLRDQLDDSDRSRLLEEFIGRVESDGRAAR